MNRLITAPAALATACLLLLGASAVTTSDHQGIAACAHEDSTHCVWVAADQGNHRGESFYATQTGDVFHLTHEEARTLIE